MAEEKDRRLTEPLLPLTEYKVQSSLIRKWFKIIGAIPFLEPGSVVDFWYDSVVGSLPPEMYEFGAYVERTWIGSVNGPTAPIFDTFLWNQYDAVLAGLPRSNNLVEGWHNGFQTLFGTSNPKLWTFLLLSRRKRVSPS